MVTWTLFFKHSFIWLKLYLKHALYVSFSVEITFYKNILDLMLENKILRKNLYVMLTRK